MTIWLFFEKFYIIENMRWLVEVLAYKLSLVLDSSSLVFDCSISILFQCEVEGWIGFWII